MKKIIILSIIVFAFLGAFSQSLLCHVNVDHFGEPDYSTPFIYRVDYDNINDITAPVPENHYFWVQTGQSGGYITVTHKALPQVEDNDPGPYWKFWLSPNYITVRFEENDTGVLNFDFKWYKMLIRPAADANYQYAD